MLTHSEIWKAIDTLARTYGLSPSGLARKAGLDPTTFNKSKRITREGKARWPSTESVSKVLRATGASLEEFVAYISGDGTNKVVQRVPVIGYAQAGKEGFFDDAGFPVGNGWDEVEFPNVGDPNAYALEVAGESMEPVYRDGDVVIVSPAAGVRRGDRVVVKTTEGEVMAKELVRQSAIKIELTSINQSHGDRTLAAEDVAFMHRIVWSSQ